MRVKTPESYRCVVGEGFVGGDRGGGGGASMRDTLSFRLEGQRVGRGSEVGWGGGSQGPVSRLVFSQNVLAAAQLLPHVRHLHAEGGVLLLQEAGPDGDLVLLQPPGVPRPLGRHVVLSAPGPVPVVLRSRADGSAPEITAAASITTLNLIWASS